MWGRVVEELDPAHPPGVTISVVARMAAMIGEDERWHWEDTAQCAKHTMILCCTRTHQPTTAWGLIILTNNATMRNLDDPDFFTHLRRTLLILKDFRNDDRTRTLAPWSLAALGIRRSFIRTRTPSLQSCSSQTAHSTPVPCPR